MDDFENSSDESVAEAKQPAARAKNRFASAFSSDESDSDSSRSSASDSDSDSDSGSDSGSSLSGSDRDSNSSSDSDSDSSSGPSSDDSSSDDSDSSDGSEDWDMSEESSESENEELTTREQRMRRWLKDTDEESDYETAKKPQQAASGWEVKRAARKERKVANQAKAAEEPDTEVSKPQKEEKLTEKDIVERSREILSGKSRKESTNAVSELAKLDEYLSASAEFGISLELSLSVGIISYILDPSTGIVFSRGFLLDSVFDRLSKVVTMMKAHPSQYPMSMQEYQPMTRFDESTGKTVPIESNGIIDPEAVKRARNNGNASITAIAELIDDEFAKSFANLESNEYATKLAILPNLVRLIISVREYVLQESVGHIGSSLVGRLSLRLLWHMHYQSKKSLEILTARVPELASISVSNLTTSVFSFGSKREKASAILLSAFIAASNNEFSKAKRLVSSDLFDLIAVSDVSLQIQYNRALAMVGVCAFVHGDVADAYNLLSDICTSGRLRELLAQGTSRPVIGVAQTSAESAAAADKVAAEKRRLLPYHIHMNMELVESAFNLSAMILEVSNLSQGLTGRRQAKYKRQMDSYDRQMYTGPPESARDSVVLAGKAILNDDVEKAVTLIDSMRIWDSIPDSKGKIIGLVRAAALETYLLNNVASHKSFNLGELVQSFGLTNNEVHSSVCRLIMSGQIGGKIKEGLLILTNGAQSKMQTSTNELVTQTDKFEKVCREVSDFKSTGSETSEEPRVTSEIMALLNGPSNLTPGTQAPEVGARRVRGLRIGPSHSKGIAALQQAAEKRLQAGLARRRGWDNARPAQPLQGTVISTERKKLFDRSYGY